MANQLTHRRWTSKLKVGKQRGWFIFFFVVITSILTPRAGASLAFNHHQISIFSSLILNIFLLYVALLLIQEVKKVSVSSVWNNIYVGNIYTIVDAVTLHLLLVKYFNILGTTIALIVAVLYTYAVFMVDVGEYQLIKPLLKGKEKTIKVRSIIFFIFFIPLIWFFFNGAISMLEVPYFENISILYLFIILFCFVSFAFLYDFIFLSKSYSEIGFVSKPFLWSSSGAVSLFIGSLLLFYKLNLQFSYYPILSFFIPVTLALSYYLTFAIEYPALLQPKWKVLLPFDLPKVTIAMTLGLLAASFYLTAKSYSFTMFEDFPSATAVAFLLPVFLATLLIFTYLEAISSRTKLRYWSYLKLGLSLHLIVSLYVFCIIFNLWTAPTGVGAKVLLYAVLFGLFSFAFYLAFALDLRTILRDQAIIPIVKRLDILLHLIFFSSLFSLIFFTLFLTYGRVTFFGRIEFVSYPIILFFIAFFLIAFGAYLSITHKGFEEVMQKNIWSELSYIFAFAVFLVVYMLYSSLSEHLHHYPYHNLAFVGYFAVLLIEIFSTMTLSGESRYKKTKKENIIHLLNFHAHNFLRTDYLEHLWEETIARFVPGEELQQISFDSQNREFHLETVDERTQVAVAVAILLAIHKMPDVEKVMIKRESHEEIKTEMVRLLGEKILMLPEELRAEFDSGLYYPILYERAINNLLAQLRAFIPLSEQLIIFDRLKRRDELFNFFEFEQGEMRIREATRFSRDEFLKLFKLYLEALGDEFPFKRCLLRGLVKEEIRTDVHAPFAASEIFDIISTGIKELNLVMAGGLVKGSSTLLIAEETKAKQKMILSLMKRNLPEGVCIIYATSKRPYRQIQGELLMELGSVDSVTILDLYEPLYEEKGISELIEYENQMLVPLNKILFQRSLVKVIKRQPRNHPRIVIIDVYDDFARYYQPEETYGLLQNQLEGLKRWNCTTVIVLDPHSHLLRKVGKDEVEKNFENILILSGVEKETVVQIEKLYQGTPSKRVLRLD
jgi:KaiC/GvpD/RAD55 family RecA-like ATPase